MRNGGNSTIWVYKNPPGGGLLHGWIKPSVLRILCHRFHRRRWNPKVGVCVVDPLVVTVYVFSQLLIHDSDSATVFTITAWEFTLGHPPISKHCNHPLHIILLPISSFPWPSVSSHPSHSGRILHGRCPVGISTCPQSPWALCIGCTGTQALPDGWKSEGLLPHCVW